MLSLGLLFAVIAPVVIVLCVVFGVAVGWFFVSVVRLPPEHVQQERAKSAAKQAARKAVDETLHQLFSD